MPKVLGEFDGGFQVQLDDGTTTLMPAELARGFVGQGLGLEIPQPAQAQQAQPPPPIEAAPVEATPPQQVQAPARGFPTPQTPDEVLAPSIRAAEQEKVVLNRGAELEGQKAEAAQPFLDQEAQERQARAGHIAQANAEAQQKYAEYEANIDAKLAAVPKQDANRLWNSRSTFQKALLVGGAFAAGFSGGTRGAESYWNSISDFIDKDMREQSENIATAKDEVTRAERAAERGRQNIIDRRRLDNEGYMERLASIKAGLFAEQAKYDSPLIRNKYDLAIQRIDQGIAEKRAEAGKLYFSQQMQVASARAEQAYQRATLAQRAKEHADEMELKRGKAAVTQLQDPNTGAAWSIGAKTADAEQRLKNWADPKTGISSYAHLTTELKEYMALANKLGRSYSGPGARTSAVVSEQQQMRAELEGKYEQIIQKTRHQLFGAALTAREEKGFLASLPKPDGMLGPEGAKTIQGYIKTKAEEAQREFINPLDVRNAEGKKVDLIKEWGEAALPEEPGHLNSPALLESGRNVGAGLSALPRDAAGAVPDELGREQVNLLTARATELARRANQFASRTGMTPEVGAQTVETMKEWAARLSSAGYEKESNQVFQQALQMEDAISNAGIVETSEIRSQRSIPVPTGLR